MKLPHELKILVHFSSVLCYLRTMLHLKLLQKALDHGEGSTCTKDIRAAIIYGAALFPEHGRTKRGRNECLFCSSVGRRSLGATPKGPSESAHGAAARPFSALRRSAYLITSVFIQGLLLFCLMMTQCGIITIMIIIAWLPLRHREQRYSCRERERGFRCLFALTDNARRLCAF
jgi:hypothetical protein